MIRIILPLLATGLTACQGPSGPLTRTDFRQNIVHAPPEPLRTVDPAQLPPEFNEALATGMAWLTQQRDTHAFERSSEPIALQALAYMAAYYVGHADPAWDRVIDDLIQRQQPAGAFGVGPPDRQPYVHAVTARALAYAAQQQPNRADWVQAAIRASTYILEQQQPQGGWHYGYAQGTRASTPLTVAHMEALFAARPLVPDTADLDTALHAAAEHLASVQDPVTGQFGYLMRGVGATTMYGYALYGLQLAGWGQSLSARRAWHQFLAEDQAWPEQLARPLWAAYYMHRAHRHQGGWPWQQWQPMFYRELLAGQHPDGYWTAPRAETNLGPIYATALALLMLAEDVHGPILQHRAPAPGPVYRIAAGSGVIHILPSALIEAPDALLLDSTWFDAWQTADAVWIEGSLRHGIHELIELLETSLAPAPRPAEWVRQLHRIFDVPAAAGSRVWEQLPDWAIAWAVWAQKLEQADRRIEQQVEAAVARRMPPGQRTQAILPHDFYARHVAALNPVTARKWLEHTLHVAAEIPRIADQLANAWASGDETSLEAATAALFPTDPVARADLESFLLPMRAAILARIKQTLQDEQQSWFILPVWHLYGDQGILALLSRDGYIAQKVQP